MMAAHTITFSLNDPIYRLLLERQQSMGKTERDGKAISADVYAKELITDFLDPEGKYGKENIR